jgi:hypothetical protein
VVKRSAQERHSRRLRTWPPSATSRESITLVSSKPQKGQRICASISLVDKNRPALRGALQRRSIHVCE